jgi:hypothetical protein
MNQACVESVAAAGTLHQAMVLARAFDSDHEIGEVEMLPRLTHPVQSSSQMASRVLHRLRHQKGLAIKVR